MENIIIAGRGKTSRANIEALMEDHYYANKNVTVIIVGSTTESDAQAWVRQHATDMKISVLGTHGPSSILDTFAEYAGTDTSVFLIWDDEDTECQDALRAAKHHKFPVYDLTNGLYQIEGAPDIPKVVAPKMPPEEVVDMDEDTEYEDVEDDGDDTEEDPLLAALEFIAEYIADAVYDRIVEASKGRK
jgi:hypothetical protein